MQTSVTVAGRGFGFFSFVISTFFLSCNNSEALFLGVPRLMKREASPSNTSVKLNSAYW